MDIKPEATIKDILTVAKQNNKVINILIHNGKTYRGSVVQLGAHHVRLALREQMSFYDVFIRIEHISAVEIPMRI